MIKWLLISLSLLATCILSYSQENINSLYFETPLPITKEKLDSFPDEIQGCYYKDNDSLIQLCISHDSIYTSFTLVFPIANRDLTELKYEKIDTLLFGLKGEKGIPYIEVNDTVYAYLKQTNLFFKISTKNIAKKEANKYYLNEKLENNFFNIIELFFTENKLIMAECDPDGSNFPYANLNLKEIKKDAIHLARPDEKNWKDFIKKNGFNDQTKYHQ